jgi:hypothetical protein
MIDTDCIGSCKSNYNTITITTTHAIYKRAYLIMKVNKRAYLIMKVNKRAYLIMKVNKRAYLIMKVNPERRRAF